MTAPVERVYDQYGQTAVLSLQDRGLAYGDGIFETMRVHEGRIPLLERHADRLALGLERLGMPAVAASTLRRCAPSWVTGRVEGVLKVIVTRGSGGRGYLPPDVADVRLLVSTHALPAIPAAEEGLRLGSPGVPLSVNPALAGIKHLNRLEQVLARREMSQSGFDEGLMFDARGFLVEAVAANVMLVREGRLMVPVLDGAGVSGVMSGWCLDWARSEGIPVTSTRLTKADVLGADEVLLCNAVRGVMPARQWEHRHWSDRRMFNRLRDAIRSGLPGF